jgi:dTDP-4-dehydrorhamnose reductase
VRALVTGAGGLLGRALVPVLRQAGHEVRGLTHRDADVTDYQALSLSIREFRPDWVMHLAAYTRVDDCERHPDRARVNEVGARNAALAAAGSEAAILLISTDYVFDGSAAVPYREPDPTGPLNVYGVSKLDGERAVREVHPRPLIVRSSWFYGPLGSNFVDSMLDKARAGEALRVVDDQRGSPTLTTDLAEAVVLLVATAAFGTYHCTGSGDCTWYDLAAHAFEVAGLKPRLGRTDSASFAAPARRPAYSVLSNALYEQVTGHRMPHWRDAVSRHVRATAGPARVAS